MSWAYVGFEGTKAEAQKEIGWMKKTYKRYKDTKFKVVKVDAKTYAIFRQT